MLAGVTRWLVTLLFVFLMVPASARSERLPIKAYTTADGLAHNHVTRIVRDSHGFLWFCTREGLSRFDGYAFTNYGIQDGLPSAQIADLLEATDGTYWIATDRGLVHFDPLGVRADAALSSPDHRRMFTTYTPPGDGLASRITSLLHAPSGGIWVGSLDGLHHLAIGAAGTPTLSRVKLDIPAGPNRTTINTLAQDRFGGLWIGTPYAVHRRFLDGRVETYRVTDRPADDVTVLLFDERGRLWIGTLLGGLIRLRLDDGARRVTVERTYGARDGLPTERINHIVQTSDGDLWASTNRALVRLIAVDDDTHYAFHAYGRSHGLPYDVIWSVAEDSNGNLWIGTSSGVAKLVPEGPTVFDPGDGMEWTLSLAHDGHGDPLVIGGPRGTWYVNRVDGTKVVAGRHHAFGDSPSWAWNQGLLVDREGDWWIATRSGVLRFRGVTRVEALARATPIARYTRRHGLAADVVIRLFEDSRGDVWIATVGEGHHPNGLSRWNRATDTFSHFAERDGLPPFGVIYVSGMAEDSKGGVWIGFTGDAGLVRFHDGRFAPFGADLGGPRRSVRNLLVDSRGRLWIATFGAGLGRIDEPTTAGPEITWYNTGNGLSSDELGAIVEDADGHLYVGTARGIDQLDLLSNRIVRRYTARDGLPAGEIQAAIRARDGALWFSFIAGLARVTPDGHRAPPPPVTLISGLRVNGEPHPLSALGQVKVAAIEVGADRNHLQIDFGAVDFGPGASLRYQYRLEGADRMWTQPSDQRSVTYANLAPGTYRFSARAVTDDGQTGDGATLAALTILPPIWQRWWFLSLAGTVLLVGLYGAHRYRTARLLEVAQMRARIATDLHDDIGANLTRIAVLSEVVRQQSGDGNSPASVPLASIATVARESVASMGDIVWAINPERDRLNDLLRRMRAHAEDVFAHGNVTVTLNAPDASGDAKLGVDVRRDLFLIFKEAINNAARHAVCSAVHINLHLDRATLVLEVTDDGIGFDPLIDRDGNGLVSMGRRARALGGRLDVMSRGDAGTTVRVTLSLARARPRIFGPLHRQVGDRDEPGR